MSQYIRVERERERERHIFASNHYKQTILVVIDAIARYLASMENFETTLGFLLFQEIIESPKKIQNLVVDLRSI